MSEQYLGEIRMVAFNFPPRGWAFCNGQIMQISQNQALYSLLGNMYGGDGSTTFALPDLRETDAEGHKHLGFEVGKPSAIICVNGMYPPRD